MSSNKIDVKDREAYVLMRAPKLYQASKLFELLPERPNDLWQMDVTYLHIPGYGWWCRGCRFWSEIPLELRAKTPLSSFNAKVALAAIRVDSTPAELAAKFDVHTIATRSKYNLTSFASAGANGYRVLQRGTLTMICGGCGSALLEPKGFCPDCGKKIDSNRVDGASNDSSVVASLTSEPKVIKPKRFDLSAAPDGHTNITKLFGIGAFSMMFAFVITMITTSEWEILPQTNVSTKQIIEKAERSVAFIQGKHTSGTGFLVEPGVIVTNKHVIDGEFMEHVKIEFPAADAYRVGPYTPTLIYEDPHFDLAFLRVTTSLPVLQIAPPRTFSRGEEVTVIGNPGLSEDVVLKNAVSRGVLSTEATIDGKRYHQLGISINHGNSGGPVLDNNGHVIGVVTLKASEKEGLGFCITLDDLNRARSKLASLSQVDIERTQSQHRVRVTFFFVFLESSAYALSLQVDESGLRSLIGEHTDMLRDRVQMFSTLDLERNVSTIRNDKFIPHVTRKQFDAFWRNCLEMKMYSKSSRGGVRYYRNDYKRLVDNHKALSASLKRLLDLPVE